ncbi:hypothetical protein NONI108955_25760 [Nocardia ninae]|uniref:hypothetical protein n=1 Tax=Nocardia ninae TaxID=356145 RepID=UPI001FEBA423|nr:hypothetical protein [Nocardia ninae]
MVVRRMVQQGLAVIAVAVLASACGGNGDEPSTPSRDRSTTVPTSTSAPNVPTAAPTQIVPPPPGNPPQGTGTVVIRTRTLSGTPVPNVPVNLSLIQPCDPSKRDIPLGSNEVLRRDAVTDGNGAATFSVPIGCYHFGMGTPPPGTTPVPEGMHSLFLVRDGELAAGELRFQEPDLPAPCAAQSIVHDLDDIGELGSHNATVTECDGNWAVIAWDAPGDTQRIVRRTPDGWATYVYFPHNVCWTKASADGVPTRLQKYFNC